MNVSGLKIDVSKATVQTTTSWRMPYISVTPITQMHVIEGPGNTPENELPARPHSDFSCGLLLNAGENAESQKPLGQIKQPSLNIPSSPEVHVGYDESIDCGK
ncbi:hypothetical protein O181_000915 [Austropuccinia psidii MF-1]|uniref:Uncharacterized protein n=1 Tax=Austropuccinia psidii MF-1 TaxID=1389203 RepID=A0A9Q3GBB6_9BASI|nr:hypothetical protein [Austropuccinia psidii MF-1]